MKLREIRIYRGKKQKEVADAVQVDRTTYCKYESESCEPPVRTLIAIAKYLEVPITQLIGDGAEEPSLPPDEQDILDDYRQLSDQGKEYIRQQFFMAKKIYQKPAALSELAE